MSKIIFFDIETVPAHKSINEAEDFVRYYFSEKFKKEIEELAPKMSDLHDTDYQESLQLALDEVYKSNAALFPEFAKIVCISVGYINGNDVKTKSFAGLCEKSILSGFREVITGGKAYSTILGGHNIIDFDIPFVCKRMLHHEMPVPSVINMSGKKPWEITHVDTVQILKFGSFSSRMSLANVCHLLGVKTPKDDIKGSQVGSVYYSGKEGSIKRIQDYCEKDVIATAQIYSKISKLLNL